MLKRNQILARLKALEKENEELRNKLERTEQALDYQTQLTNLLTYDGKPQKGAFQ